MPDDFHITVTRIVKTETEKGTVHKVSLENKDLGCSLTMSFNTEFEIKAYPVGSIHHISLKNPQTTLDKVAPTPDAPHELTEEQKLLDSIHSDQREMTEEEKAAFGIDGGLGEHESSEDGSEESEEEESEETEET